jgi:hypothetical protein
MQVACKREAARTARFARLEAEFYTMVREYSLPLCEIVPGSRDYGDHSVSNKDACYRKAVDLGLHMACLHRSGTGACLARPSIETNTILCDAIPAELARMKCFEYLAQHGGPLHDYSRAELFRTTELVIFDELSQFIELLQDNSVKRQNITPLVRAALAEPRVCTGRVLEEPRRIAGGRELGDRISYIRRCERRGPEFRVELVSYR